MNTAASMSPPPLSLLSLSDAAASAHHIPVHTASSVPAAAPIPIKQRHRSSFSQIRKRRPSDARDPLLTHSVSPPPMQNVLSRASEDHDRVASSRVQALSLSPPGVHTNGQGPLSKSVPLDVALKDDGAQAGGKKKGTTFRCESCSKVYRHPSCLVKHRWEHSPHWREASKFLLSKHQQVQLLEAAAILSHLSPTESGGGTSLPEDRSLWPSYLSGGLLPLPAGSTGEMSEDDQLAPPALTQFRPGLLGHPNPTPSLPMAVPAPRWEGGWRETSVGSGSGGGSWTHTPYTSTSGPFSLSVSSERGWSLPRSSVRGGDSDEEPEEENDNDKDGTPAPKEKEEQGQEWDGMEMEMDL